MSTTAHYRLDPSSCSVVCICTLCDWRGLGLDNEQATALVRRHITQAHPATNASRSAERHLRRVV